MEIPTRPDGKVVAAEDDLEIRRLVLGPYENNVYLVTCRATGESLIVDAPAPWQEIVDALGPCKPEAIVITHRHGDHTGGLAALRQALGVPVAAHVADAEAIPGPVTKLLHDGDVLRVGKLRLRVIHTPGHTPGSICLLAGRYLISGDTLFPGGPGNTRGNPDNFAEIIDSIRSKLFTLPDETIVFPGHGGQTTIETERPHLDDWIARGW